MFRRTFLLGYAVLAGIANLQIASAEDFPARPMSVVVSFAAGGPIDAGARIIAQGAQKVLGKPMIVMNKPGAKGIIGSTFVKDAQPDGYTLFFQSVSSLNKTLIREFPFELTESLDPVAPSFVVSYCLFVNTQVPANTLAELVAYAKKKPGVLNYGAQTASTSLGVEMLKSKAGIDLVAIPYSGSAPAMTALIAGDIQLLMDNPGGTAAEYVQSGKLKALACTDRKRNPTLPNVPTMIEAGYPDVVVTLTGGFWAPKGLDQARKKILNEAINKVLEEPETKAQMLKTGFVSLTGSADELLSRVKAEQAFWVEAARISNFEPQ